MEEEASPEVMDAVLIGLDQQVEHYEIASYGTLCIWAGLLEYKIPKKSLAQHMDEVEN
jgi:ferritin-like metal-binding protein YciE